jgi:sensor domain CHASE-containing protein
MTRKKDPENKSRIRQSPLPVIGVAVAVILLVFYGWSQRVWLSNVTDIESRDVDMQSRQLERGYVTELEDVYSALGDYSIWSETAEYARGNRPNFFPESNTRSRRIRTSWPRSSRA